MRSAKLAPAAVVTALALTWGLTGCGQQPRQAPTAPSSPARAEHVVPSSPATPAPPRALDRAKLTKAVKRYLARRPGQASLTVIDRATGTTYRFRSKQTVVTASAVKVNILIALLLRAQRRDRGLTASERALAEAMIRHSDNKAADRLYVRLGGPGGMNAINRKLGLRHTRFIPGSCLDLLCWSLTETTTDDQARLLRLLADASSPLRPAHRAYVLKQMGHVIKAQRWGITAAAQPGDEVAVKNGWMTRQSHGDLWVISSMGRVRGHGHDFLMAVFTHHNPSAETGIQTVEALARMVTAAFPPQPPTGGSGGSSPRANAANG